MWGNHTIRQGNTIRKEIEGGRTNFEKGGITNIGKTFIKQGVSDPLPTIISNTQQDSGIL